MTDKTPESCCYSVYFLGTYICSLEPIPCAKVKRCPLPIIYQDIIFAEAEKEEAP